MRWIGIFPEHHAQRRFPGISATQVVFNSLRTEFNHPPIQLPEMLFKLGAGESWRVPFAKTVVKSSQEIQMVLKEKSLGPFNVYFDQIKKIGCLCQPPGDVG